MGAAGSVEPSEAPEQLVQQRRHHHWRLRAEGEQVLERRPEGQLARRDGLALLPRHAERLGEVRSRASHRIGKRAPRARPWIDPQRDGLAATRAIESEFLPTGELSHAGAEPEMSPGLPSVRAISPPSCQDLRTSAAPARLGKSSSFDAPVLILPSRRVALEATGSLSASPAADSRRDSIPDLIMNPHHIDGSLGAELPGRGELRGVDGGVVGVARDLEVAVGDGLQHRGEPSARWRPCRRP